MASCWAICSAWPVELSCSQTSMVLSMSECHGKAPLIYYIESSAFELFYMCHVGGVMLCACSQVNSRLVGCLVVSSFAIVDSSC